EMTNSWPVQITNKKCAGVTPNNEKALNNVHTQSTTKGGEWGGHLSAPFQPFGEYELCLAAGGKHFKVKAYNNESETAAVTRNIYLTELTQSERENARVAAETKAREAREATETAARTKRESEENATRKAREAAEAVTKTTRLTSELPAKEQWEKEEKSEQETKTKEAETKSAREAAEKSEQKPWETEV